MLPFATHMSGLLYLCGAVVLGVGFLVHAVALCISDNERLPMKTFGYSIVYLMGLFTVLLVDHYML